ncbi:MAG: adenine nucleotide alpha hydrolase [Hyphomicrobiaceae bacterium]
MVDGVEAEVTANADGLAKVLAGMDAMTIAVSGGVDSMTLACFAHRQLGRERVQMVHGTSPAVPGDAGGRIHELAVREGWRLDVVDAGEFADPAYRANPINRCFYCKSNLYRTLGDLSDGFVLSGTNCDDLGDYRPGLEAARNHNVRHPYVEAGFAKKDVRQLAAALELPEYAALPASPCLSSRVETGLAIRAVDLAMIDAVEAWCREQLAPETVRCRLRRIGLVIELDPATHGRIKGPYRTELMGALRDAVDGLATMPIAFANYQRGSAFVGDRSIIS